MQKTPLECKSALLAARQQWGQGLINEKQLYAVADEYIEAIKDYKNRTNNKKLRIPTASYLIRAL